MHVVLLELLVDPLCSLAFESEPSAEADMARRPRPAGELLFGRRHIILAAAQGAMLLAAVLGLYAWTVQVGMADGVARATAFVALVIGNLSLALADASGGVAKLTERRLVFWAIGGLGILVLALCLLVPWLSEILRFAMPPAALLILAVASGIATGGFARFVQRAA